MSGSVDNLNLLTVREDGDTLPPDRLRPDISGQNGTEVYFQNLETKLIERIREYPVVVGCMAWLTNDAILTELANRDAVSVIIQKEDFLRPDSGNWSTKHLRLAYSKLRGFDDYQAMAGYNYCSAPDREAVRCVGICAERSKTPPRMHHKFLVFCNYEPHPDLEGYGNGAYSPQAVWTGSFNATHNGTRSLENAVLLRDPEVARGFYNEWLHVLGLSEELDWTSPYVSPEYRFGT